MAADLMEVDVPSSNKVGARTGISATPRHRLIVLPWLKPIAQRLIMPNWLAITIGRLILAWRPLEEPELAHELVHVRQWGENGFVHYIVRYMRESSKAAAAGGDRYRDNKFEAEAYAEEERVRARSGRQGTAAQ
jgi:hypothetical protein